MAATAHDTWSLEEDEVVTVSLEDAQAHDAYWQQAHAHENYYRRGLDYEDYAPAYCVGYIGQVQYGGEFDDAEKSLLANWLRIKGDSRLSIDEARMAIRAAWDRAAFATQPAMDIDAQPQPVAGFLRGVLESANEWLDSLDERLFGDRPQARPLPRRTQQSGFARH